MWEGPPLFSDLYSPPFCRWDPHLVPMDTLGGEATIRWDLSIGVGGWGSLKLSDRLRTCRESGVKRQGEQCGPHPM